MTMLLVINTKHLYYYIYVIFLLKRKTINHSWKQAAKTTRVVLSISLSPPPLSPLSSLSGFRQPAKLAKHFQGHFQLLLELEFRARIRELELYLIGLKYGYPISHVVSISKLDWIMLYQKRDMDI